MQNGSLMKTERRNGQSVWEFRWRDRTSGRAVYRRIPIRSSWTCTAVSHALPILPLDAGPHDEQERARVKATGTYTTAPLHCSLHYLAINERIGGQS